MIVCEKPDFWRGTIEVWPYHDAYVEVTEWYWHCKSNNGQVLGHGEGYRRKSGALNAIDAQYSVKLVAGCPEWVADMYDYLVVPWRLIVRDRHGDDTIGAVY